MERDLEKRNEASGERAVEKPLRGKVQKTDFSTSLGNPQKPRISTFPQPRRLLLIFYAEGWRTKTQNPTSSEINLLQRKNGLDNGVHLSSPRLQIELFCYFTAATMFSKTILR